MSITIKILDNQRLSTRLRGKSSQIINALILRTNRMLYALQDKIQNYYLSGGALQSVSGRLRGSVRVIPARLGQARTSGGQFATGFNLITGYVEGGGGPAFYGVFFEKGGTHSYEIFPVNKKALAFAWRGKNVIFAHVMHPPIPHKPFMGPAIDEMWDEIVANLQEAVTEVEL